ncbi:hypothetical protein FRC06_009358 [Ceratobasidium sp. 370]|nr:hypothetical protein FRC06_009358 [Ceratobasidium sp. 370]
MENDTTAISNPSDTVTNRSVSLPGTLDHTPMTLAQTVPNLLQLTNPIAPIFPQDVTPTPVAPAQPVPPPFSSNTAIAASIHSSPNVAPVQQDTKALPAKGLVMIEIQYDKNTNLKHKPTVRDTITLPLNISPADF